MCIGGRVRRVCIGGESVCTVCMVCMVCICVYVHMCICVYSVYIVYSVCKCKYSAYSVYHSYIPSNPLANCDHMLLPRIRL